MGDDPSSDDAVPLGSISSGLEYPSIRTSICPQSIGASNKQNQSRLQRLFGAVATRCQRRRHSAPSVVVDQGEPTLIKPSADIPAQGVAHHHAIHSAVQQMESLPAHIQAHLFGFSNLQGASSLATTCSELHQGIWEDAEIWKDIFVGEQPEGHKVVPTQKAAQTLRDDVRWRRYGIDALCGWRKRPPAAQHATALKAAHRAIYGLLPGDGPRNIDSIVSAMTDLLRWYDATDDAAHENARALVKAAAARKEVFTREHIRELRRALDDSKVLRESLTTTPLTMTMEGSSPFAVLFNDEPSSSPFFLDDGGSSSDVDRSPSSSIFHSRAANDLTPKVAKRGSSFSSFSPEASSTSPFGFLDEDDAAMDRVLNALRDTTAVR